MSEIRNHIIPVDDGFYRQAATAKSSPMTYLSNQVIAKLRADGKDHNGRDIDVVADAKAHVSRTLKRLGVADDASPMAVTVREYALDSYGFYKEMDARGINYRRDTGAKFFNVTANTPLFPMFLATTFVESRIVSGLVDQLCYADIQIDRASYDKVRLTDSADDTELRNVEIGGTLPLTDLSNLGTNIPLRKYGRRFQFARETQELTPLAVTQAFIRRFARRIASNETDEVLEILHAGDGETGSPVVDTTPANNGVLAYNDLITLEMAFNNGYTGNVYVADSTNFTNILKMVEYKDPLARRELVMTNGIPNVPTPSTAGRIYRWQTGRCTYMAEAGGRIAGVDNTAGCYCVRKGNLLEEQDTIIASGKVEVALSYLFACVKGDPDAFESLDVTA